MIKNKVLLNKNNNKNKTQLITIMILVIKVLLINKKMTIKHKLNNKFCNNNQQ